MLSPSALLKLGQLELGDPNDASSTSLCGVMEHTLKCMQDMVQSHADHDAFFGEAPGTQRQGDSSYWPRLPGGSSYRFTAFALRFEGESRPASASTLALLHFLNPFLEGKILQMSSGPKRQSVSRD